MSVWGHIALFAGGTLFGSAGFAALASDNARKVYTHVTAAGMRAKDGVVNGAADFKANCDDIVADAKELNEEKAAKKEAKAAKEAEVEFEDVTDEEPEEAPKKAAPKKKTAAKKSAK